MKQRTLFHTLPAFACILAAGPGLLAQATTGTLSGTIKDASGKPIPGAKVVLESPALFAPRVLIVTERGEWRAPLLSPGTYRITATHPGSITSSAQHVRVGLGTTGHLDLVLKPIKIESLTVEVVSDNATTIDKADSKVSTNFSSEELSNLAVGSRTFEGASFLAPGVSSGTGEPSIRGGMTNSTLYRVNGVDIKNDLQGGRTGTGVLEDMIEDIQVVTSPLNARNGRTTGGSINVVTKQGSNTWAGSYRAVLERDAWRAHKHGEDPSGVASQSDTLNKEHIITLLGPIIKDRLWFSFGTKITPNEKDTYQMAQFSTKPGYDKPWVTGVKNIDGITNPTTPATSKIPAGYAFSLFDTGKYFQRNKDKSYYEGKLSFAINSNHTLEGSGVLETELITPRDSSSKATIGMLDSQTTDRMSWGIGYKGILGPSAFLEARFNSSQSENSWPKFVDPNVPEPVWVSVNDKTSKALLPFSTDSAPSGKELRGNKSAAVNLKLYWEGMGTHDTDLGGDLYVGRRGLVGRLGTQNRTFYTGGAYGNGQGQWLFPAIRWTGDSANKQYKGTYGLAPVMRQAFGEDGETQSPTMGIYANDTWTLNSHWLVMGGIRFDRMKVKDTDGAWLADTRAISPRFMVKYDPTGTSEHLFTFSAAQFSDDFITGFTTAFVKTASATSSYVGWTGGGLNQPLPGATTDPMGQYGVRFINYSELSNPANWKNANGAYNTFSVASKSGYTIDPDLKAPIAHELSLGYARQLKNGDRVSFTYSWRRWKQSWAFAQDYRQNQWQAVSDPMGNTQKVILQTTRVFNSDDLKRQYQGVDVEFRKRLSESWMLQGSLTYSHLTGNDQGGDQVDDTNRSNSVNPYYNQRDFLLSQGIASSQFAPEGLLAANQTFKGRMSLVGRFPLGQKGGYVSYAWLMTFDSGSRFSASDSAPLHMDALPAMVPNVPNPVLPLTYGKYYGGRGTYGKNDTLGSDAKLSWEIPLGFSKVRLIGDLMVYNVFNRQAKDGSSLEFLASSSGSNFLLAKYPDIQGTTRPGTKYEGDYYVSPRSAEVSIGLKF